MSVQVKGSGTIGGIDEGLNIVGITTVSDSLMVGDTQTPEKTVHVHGNALIENTIGNNLTVRSTVNNGNDPNFIFEKGRGGGTPAIVQNGDDIGNFQWSGYDGNSYEVGASILAEVEGTPSDGDMPMRMTLKTRSAGAGSEQGRIQISADGTVSLVNDSNLQIPDKIIHSGDTNTAIRFPSADNISFETGGVERLRIADNGMVGIGTNSPAITLHVAGAADSDVLMVGTYTGGNYAQVRGHNQSGIRIRGGGSYGGGMIDLGAGLRGTDPGVIKFHTGTNVTASNNEHMRIQTNGEIAMASNGTITDAQANLHVQNETFRVSNPNQLTSYCHITAYESGDDGDRAIIMNMLNNVPKFNVTRQGQVFGSSHHYAGRARTDANTPVNYYSHGAFGFYAFSGRTDTTENYRSSVFMRAWDAGDTGDRNVIYYTDSGSDTTTVDYDQHQKFGIKANGMAQFGSSVFAGRTESDETTPNSVYTGASGTTFIVYPNSSSYYTRMDARTTDNTDQVFKVDSGGGVVIKFQSDGNGRFDGGADIGSASDYAEYFEWLDGNTSSVDRRGITVILDGEKIRPATDSDDTSKIIGVVSANPAVVGDSAWSEWQLAHLKDAYGSWVTKDEEFLVWNKFGTFTDTDGVKKPNPQPDINDYNMASDFQILVSDIEKEKEAGRCPQAAIDQNLRVTKPSRTYNPDYDKTRTYVPRSQRKEWDAIGLMGKLVVRRGQPIGANWILMKSNVGVDPNDSSIILDKYLVR